MIFDVKITQSELNISSEIVSDKSLHFVVDFPIWIKGEKGDPFTYADFTAEQIKQLQQPALEAATLANEATDKANTVSDKVIVIEGTVIKNEDKRIVNENTRVENEKERSDGFSSAITLIGNKVEAAEKATTDATDSAKNAQEIASHPTYIGDDHYVYRWDATKKEYYRTDIYSKGDTGLTAYEYAVRGGYKGTEAQFIQEQVDILGNGDRLTAVESGKADKPIAGRTFLTPLFVARGAVFNDKTGYYGLNGILDIAESEMTNIYNLTNTAFQNTNWEGSLNSAKIRTNFPPYYNLKYTNGIIANSTFAFSLLEIIRLLNESPFVGIVRDLFWGCRNLYSVIGDLDIKRVTTLQGTFNNCVLLKNIRLFGLTVNCDITYSSNLSKDSIMYMINNSLNGDKVITIALHDEAKARLTPEEIALASSKNITIA